jgi:hypothetical protein
LADFCFRTYSEKEVNSFYEMLAMWQATLDPGVDDRVKQGIEELLRHDVRTVAPQPTSTEL